MSAPQVYLCRYGNWNIEAFRARFYATLSSEEHSRLASFKHTDSSHQFLIARVLLRQQLAPRLNQQANAILLDQNKFGRPFVRNATIDFNVSHTQGLVAFAVVGHPQIGVDVESTTRRGSILDIAERFLHPKEFHTIQTVADSVAQRALFFRLWTLKEAYVKAEGSGLQRDLKSFNIELAPDGRINLTDLSAAAPTLKPQLFHYHLWQDYVCSLVLIGHSASVTPEIFTVDEQLLATPLRLSE